jgi:hypothetical protein
VKGFALTENKTTPDRWMPWMVNPSAERLASYFASEIRFRLVWSIVHIDGLDEDDACAMDLLEEASGR